MKLSDYITKYLEKITDSVFLLSGGGIMHLVDSLGKSKLNLYCCHHEQAAAIAAEGYARTKDKIGVAVVTTGPGGTNAITGAAGAWLDSIPMLVISGQVKRADIMPRKNGAPIIRQLGFQEINIIDIVKPITKYAVMVENANEILYHLEKAIYLAIHGRPGPVWLDIPLDVQVTDIKVKNLKHFNPAELKERKSQISDELIKKVAKLLREAKRPLLIAGNGIRLAHGEKVLWQVLKKLKINAVTPIFTADDLVTYEYPYYLGRQGMPGNESANYAVDNCDLLLVVGERLQLTQVSWEYEKFALQAKKIMVDIDEGELKKKTIKINMPICGDAKEFLEKLCKQNIVLNRWDVEVKPINSDSYTGKKECVNVYKFLEELNNCDAKLSVATSNGMASVSSHQMLKINRGQRFITNAGLGHMGSGLPLAIGACIAENKKSVICMEGDGSIMLNLQELQTVSHHELPIKIFIFNNNGYYSIRNTHLKFFNKISAADPLSGVSLPDFSKLIPAWGLKYVRIKNNNELSALKDILKFGGPIVCELMIDPDQPMLPRWEAGMLKEKNMPIKVLVFDFDGTIVDSNEIKNRAYFKLFPLVSQKAKEIIGNISRGSRKTRYQIIREILSALKEIGEIKFNNMEKEVEKYTLKFGEIVEDKIINSDGVHGAFEELWFLYNNKYVLYILSGTPLAPLQQTIKKMVMSGKIPPFKKIYGRIDDTDEKLFKERVLSEIMEAEKVLAEEIVLIGDGKNEREVAIENGCNFIGITNDNFSVVHDLKKLRFLLELNIVEKEFKIK